MPDLENLKARRAQVVERLDGWTSAFTNQHGREPRTDTELRADRVSFQGRCAHDVPLGVDGNQANWQSVTTAAGGKIGSCITVAVRAVPRRPFPDEPCLQYRKRLGQFTQMRNGQIQLVAHTHLLLRVI